MILGRISLDIHRFVLQGQSEMEQEKRYGVWITNKYGEPNSRWLSDVDNGKDVWVGTWGDAQDAVIVRENMYSHLKYEVKEIEHA